MPVLRVRGLKVDLRPGETVLAALRRAGLPVLYSCQEGCCHSCIVRTDSPHVPRTAQVGLNPSLRREGAFLACRWAPEEDLSLWLAGERPPARSNNGH